MAFDIGDYYQAFVRPVAAEFVATCFFVFLGVSITTTGTVFIPLATGVALMATVIVFFDVSGGHVNPVVTLAVYLSGGMKLRLAVFYVLAQLLGAIMGTGFAKVAVPSKMWEASNGGSHMLVNDTSVGSAIFMEIMITANLITVVLISALDSKTQSPLTALAIGMSVTCGIFAASDVCGGSMNPARSFGSAVVSATWDHHYVYWVGPIIGSLIGVFLYNLMFASPQHLFWYRKDNTANDRKETIEARCVVDNGQAVAKVPMAEEKV